MSSADRPEGKSSKKKENPPFSTLKEKIPESNGMNYVF
jgi:hypothetical protein